MCPALVLAVGGRLKKAAVGGCADVVLPQEHLPSPAPTAGNRCPALLPAPAPLLLALLLVLLLGVCLGAAPLSAHSREGVQTPMSSWAGAASLIVFVTMSCHQL